MSSNKSSPNSPAGSPEPAVISLLEEQLDVGVAREEVGAVRVRIEVDERAQPVDAEPFEERMAIDVVPIGRDVSERRAPWRDGDALVVPVYEEALVVECRLVLREEIRLTPVRHVTGGPQQATLRRERAVVERRQPDGSWRRLTPDEIRTTREGDGPGPAA